MDPLKERLRALGAEVARASEDEAGSRARIAQVRERLREEPVSRPRRWSIPTAALVAGLAALLAVGSYGVWRAQPRGPITFTVEAQGETVDRAVQTGELETKQLRFSDGTTVSLQPSSRVEVHALTTNGATVGLLEGRARASVRPEQEAHWQFLAGPFFVQVTGTEFDLAWDPKARIFELALHEGSVEVAGPSLKSTRRVRQGEYVRIALDAEGTAMLDQRASKASERPSEQVPTTSLSSLEPLPNAEPRAKGTADASWPEMLRAGQRKAAFGALDRLGPAALEQAGSQDLWDLAHAARLGGRPELAERALLSLREKHGARGQTAFLLGKVSADQLHRAPEAIKWFQTYLAEAPQGPLAEQALGRLVELQGGTRAGKRAAKEYLARYPEGAYASFARSLLR